MNYFLIAFTLFITFLFVLFSYRKIAYVEKFRSNLSVGQMVNFYLGEERLPGKIISISGNFIRVEFCNSIYDVHQDLVYP